MNQWVVFLRGVNVGGNNKLPMKPLRDAMEAAGFEDVQTYIQSGNIVFRSSHASADAVGKAVTKLIEGAFGFAPRSHVRSADQLSRAIADNPFATKAQNDPKTVHVFFLAEAPGHKADLDAIYDLRAKSERTELIDDVFYLYAPDGIGRSKLVAQIEKWIPVPMTERNLRTVLAVHAMAATEGS
ncbi:DUF1697 domain-containing protein [Henriciella pelagia]|jgi:uncharacterized protein (DUF1697 family)|uniref:DUF1697 domain-containing protein n=1 Tax=Henriciella pelagia TaxID=1977912 RepID=A0ABQ1JYR2_9PROT|nr:DUF1697 domain-containing protein [Henriciella pelagia]GGB77776.1 hypothetical protein GCM10011503_28200 [Henriciella pelagia]